MPTFNVYGYARKIRDREFSVLTFDPVGDHPIAGTIVAPEGSSLYRPTGRAVLLLKVPKVPGDPTNCFVVDAVEAVKDARNDRLHLTWTPAGSTSTVTEPARG